LEPFLLNILVKVFERKHIAVPFSELIEDETLLYLFPTNFEPESENIFRILFYYYRK
jgi:hypothetical protein